MNKLEKDFEEKNQSYDLAVVMLSWLVMILF